MICGVPGENTHGPPWQYAKKRNGGAFESEDGCPVGAVVVKGNRTGAGSEAATLPNTRMQRTRSSPSALRSPLMRCPLGNRKGQLMALVTRNAVRDVLERSAESRDEPSAGLRLGYRAIRSRAE